MKLRTGITLALLAPAALAIIGLLCGPSIEEYLQRQPFDSAEWRKSLAQESRDEIRLRMVDDLLDRHVLRGKTRGEIEALLGTPPRTNYFPEYDYVYWLGPERGFIRIDSEWLGLKFDGSGRVSKVSLLRD